MERLTQQIVDLTSRLIERPSVTPDDAGCQTILQEQLHRQGFEIDSLPFGEVENFWATHGEGEPFMVFAGHTDVVPSGPIEHWTLDPFTPTVRDGRLYGRGSADMKGSLAAMVLATQQFLTEFPDHPGTLAYLVTSDEEGTAVDGTVKVVGHLEQRGIFPDFCIVGEPSSRRRAGGVSRIGPRGALNGRVPVKGEQRHVGF
ncbi:MAG: M20/M25/M40 family metallo-hydrolase, partial [Pseudomonadales bacterium]